MTTTSNELFRAIAQEISLTNGKISFATFMDTVLYHPQHGYYQNLKNIGPSGDFTTAPEISPLFARCIARQCLEIFPHLEQTHILELGAGSGRFAGDFLLEFNKLSSQSPHYFIYEKSEQLRLQQQNHLQQLFPEQPANITWLTALPENFSGIIIANEVLDALPVHRFCIKNNKIFEQCVTLQGDTLAWQASEPITSGLLSEARRLQTNYGLQDDYESEVHLSLNETLESWASTLRQGVMLLVDYGYGEAEYYHPARSQGTLTCFYQHKQEPNPFDNLGKQDITAHINFTRLISLAEQYGLDLLGFTTQAGFLLGCDLTTLIIEQEQSLPLVAQINLHQAIKILTLPTEMGERIKFMALGKNLPPTFPTRLRGFTLQDRRRDL